MLIWVGDSEFKRFCNKVGDSFIHLYVCMFVCFDMYIPRKCF